MLHNIEKGFLDTKMHPAQEGCSQCGRVASGWKLIERVVVSVWWTNSIFGHTQNSIADHSNGNLPYSTPLLDVGSAIFFGQSMSAKF